MVIKKIELYGFRNYVAEKIEFTDNLNIIIGKNAQGKTNLLEAVYFCVVGKSFRVGRERELINWNSEIAKIKLYLEKSSAETVIEIIFSKKDKKTIKINGIPIKKIGELMGELNAVFFAPEELKLIKESPEDRRRFMDIAISQTSKEYFYLLSKQTEILNNRNAVLKMKANLSDIKDMLSIYNVQLAQCSIKIKEYRKNFIENLAPFAKSAHEYLTDKKETLDINLVSVESQTKEDYIKNLESSFDKDFKLGYTTYGTHRDDIKILINNVDARIYGSQGQQRTASLSLKLAEMEIIKNLTNSMPILLLDDVLSELDDNRKKKLLKFCLKTQTLITCTEFEFEVGHNTIEIEQGSRLR